MKRDLPGAGDGLAGSLLSEFSKEIEEFLSVCRRLSDRFYVTSQGGNLSLKLGDDLALITPTRRRKGDIHERDLVFIDLSGNRIAGSCEPTGELPMYLSFYRARPDVRSIVHCHPPAINAFAIGGGPNWLLRPIFPETVVEVGPVPLVPYGEPLTEALAANFAPFVQHYNAFLMENHGLTMVSPEGILRTMDLIEILESSAQSILQALAVGQIMELGREEVENLENTRRTRMLPAIGAPGVNKSLAELYFSDG